MKIAIMQPYVFPYVGYFQLIQATDVFVFYNDVNFIKKGWIHRNRILLNGGDFLFTIPCQDASQNRLISETKLAFGKREKAKFLSTIVQAYRRAPHFDKIHQLVEDVISKDFEFVDELAIASIMEVAKYLELERRFYKSSERYHNQSLKREERIIDICRKENIDEYVNPIGGQGLYTKDHFQSKGVSLSFLNSTPISYEQFENQFVPWLSIIDVLMFNEKQVARSYLNNFDLI